MQRASEELAPLAPDVAMLDSDMADQMLSGNVISNVAHYVDNGKARDD